MFYSFNLNAYTGFLSPRFFIGSRCIGHLLPDALVCLISRDTGVEVVLGLGGRLRNT